MKKSENQQIKKKVKRKKRKNRKIPETTFFHFNKFEQKKRNYVETYTVFRPRFLSRVVLSQFFLPVTVGSLRRSQPVCCF